MINKVCAVLLTSGEVLLGKVELRGIYAPAYGFHLVGDGGDRQVSWTDVCMIISVEMARLAQLPMQIPVAVPEMARVG
jgi:hypothetical protein